MRFPIHIELHRSRLLLFLLLLFHTLTAASVLSLPWALPYRSVLMLLVGLSGWRALRSSEVAALRLAEDGGLSCLLTSGLRVPGLILADSVVFRQLVVLRLRVGDTKRTSSLPLLPDSMSAEQFRVLRLWLRWRAETSGGGGTPVE